MSLYKKRAESVGGGERGRADKVRGTREGWPLLTVETEVNGDSKGTKL